MEEFSGWPLPAMHNAQNPEKDNKQRDEDMTGIQSGKEVPLDIADELEALAEMRQVIRKSTKGFNDSKERAAAIEAYCRALELDLVLRGVLETKQRVVQPEQKSPFARRSQGGLQPRMK